MLSDVSQRVLEQRKPRGELAGHIRDGVRRRFYTLIDAAGFDEDRARAWVIIRVADAAAPVQH